MTAGVLLCARTLAGPLALAMPGAAEILSATGASRSRAYELAREVGELLPALARHRDGHGRNGRQRPPMTSPSCAPRRCAS